MKKIALILAALLALSALCACSGKKTVAEVTETEAKLPTLKSSDQADLKPLADALGESGLLGKNTTYMVKGDEYAEDVLLFTYGVVTDEAFNCGNYLVTEPGSNEAYSCVVMLFDGDFDNSIFESISTVYDAYAKDLKNSVVPYNPEAVKLCERYIIRRLEVKGDNSRVTAVCLFISDDNRALEDLVVEKLTEICSAN